MLSSQVLCAGGTLDADPPVISSHLVCAASSPLASSQGEPVDLLQPPQSESKEEELSQGPYCVPLKAARL